MQRVLQLFGDKIVNDVPVSFGNSFSLSPISAFPLGWRIGIDEFFQECVDNEALSEVTAPLSHHESSDLIAKVLRESDTAVAIAVTGPVTNLALALQNEPELVDRVSTLFLMGSNYGGGPNNVYGWQMTYDGVTSSCAEDAITTFQFQNTRGAMGAEAIQ
jgi:purine nucleosidase